MIDRERISETHRLIRPYVRQTPTMEADTADFGLGAGVPLTFKLELLQHAGSFKARGAFANLLLRPVPAAGVAAASGGNHGAAVAFAARRLGIPATIFVPTVTSPAKVEQIRNYGANLVIEGDRYADALVVCERWAASTGALEVHAYDQPETLLGQGTLAAELEQQAPEVDTILVAVGGGGLLSGMASWYTGSAHPPRFIGVEPELAPTLTRALEAGRPVDAEAGGIAADSLAPRRVGQLTFPIARQHVHEVILVSDGDIVQAQGALWTVLRVTAEPGGAAAMAALLSGRYRPQAGERVAVIVCGGNTTAVRFDAVAPAGGA